MPDREPFTPSPDSPAPADGDGGGLDATREFVAEAGMSEESTLLADSEVGEQTASAALRELGGFRIVAEIGRGGMGAVYEAEEIALGRRVALKVLPFGALADASAADRFRREAATVAGLHHTNIVPLFSVGSEHGIHYYAMQLITGRSLADLAQSGPVEPRRAVGWALQAAEALDHAHRRGVIHRDVKPSNLLVDADERVWLTDFGLARRLDDAALSVSGTLLGTPRYMSPEQARGGKLPVDERTDLYSLGATLYELISGRPVYEGTAPHVVIHDILTREPEPLREVAAGVSRDLDTIVMKCLEKTPARRYGSARELADDLRANLENRPIRARRPTLAEQAARWLKQQRRGVLVTAGSVAATLALLGIGLFAARLYHRWQLGFVGFTTAHPPLIAELVDAGGSQASAPITVPTQQPIELAAGAYQLRVAGDGRFDELSNMRLERGERPKFELSLEDQTLWPALDVPRAYLPLPGDRGHDLLVMDDTGLSLVDGRAGVSRWRHSLTEASGGQRPAAGFRWPWRVAGSVGVSGLDKFDLTPTALAGPIDVDRDGHNDCILSARHQAWMLALSGKDGRRLWFAARGSDVAVAGGSASWPQVEISSVLGPPELAGDLDGDGVPDLLATFADRGLPGEQRPTARWVEAISSADGHTLWRYDLDPQWFSTPTLNDAPYAFRWFYGGGYGTQGGSGSSSSSHDGIFERDRQSRIERVGEYVYLPQPAEVARLEGNPVACVLAGERALLLDLKTGRPARAALALTGRPGRPVEWRDVDGDGSPEIIVLEETAGAFPAITASQVAVYSFASQTELWRQALAAHFPHLEDWHLPQPSWPVLADLDGDGRDELLAPNGSSRRPPTGQLATLGSMLPWGELEARDAATGALRWTARILTMDQQIDHFIVGPDIDGDGSREVFAASLWGENYDVCVEALSGRDGKVLWRGSHAPRLAADDRSDWLLLGTAWWGDDRDGWPRLLVAAGHPRATDPGTSLIAFSSLTGQATAVGHGFASRQLAQLDGLGPDNLLHYRPASATAPDYGGKLEVFGGATGERWRWLGNPWRVAGDCNGDGLRDLVQMGANGTARALDGATGRVLWASKVGGAPHAQPTLRAAAGDDAHAADCDLNGDGVPDLLLHDAFGIEYRPRQPLCALSGRDGRLLWRAGFEAQGMRAVPLLTAADLDSDGEPEVVMAAAISWDASLVTPGNYGGQLWLMVLSGRTGKVRWKQPLTPDGFTAGSSADAFQGLEFGAVFGDLNHDGVRDIVVPAAMASDGKQLAMRALDGATGTTLWQHAVPRPIANHRPFHDLPPPLVADLDKDGTPEVYVLELDPAAAPANQHFLHRFLALGAADGKPLWTWETAIGGSQVGVDPDPPAARPRPFAIASATGPDLVGLNLGGRPSKVFVFDPSGAPLAEFPVTTPNEQFRVWPADVDGDGDEELILINDGKLQAVRSDGSRLWEAQLGPLQTRDVLAVRGGPRRAALLIVHEHRPQPVLHGIDGKTGALLWTSGAPRPTKRAAWQFQAALLDVSAGERPTAIFGWDATTVCARVAPTSEAAAARPAPAPLPPPGLDPRLARSLPWRPRVSPSEVDGLQLAWCGFYCLALLVLPAALGWRIVSKRRFGMRTLALMPVVAAIAMMAFLLDGPGGQPLSAKDKLGLATAALPAVVGLVVAVRWLVGRRWRRLLVWLAFSLPIAAALAALLLIGDRMRASEGQYYVFAGWYWIWPMALYATAVLLCLERLIAAAAWIVRRHRP